MRPASRRYAPDLAPLLDAPRWRVRCPAVALCYARALPVDPNRLLAAFRVCIAGAPHLHSLVDAIKKNLDAVLPDVLRRSETTPDDEWQYHPLEDLPALRPFQISRLWRRLDAASDQGGAPPPGRAPPCPRRRRGQSPRPPPPAAPQR